MLESARVGRLGIVDDADRPRVLPVTFALCEGAIYSAIDRKPKRTAEPARLRYLRRRPHAALTVDHYEDDWDRLAWVQVLGRVELLEAADHQPALQALAAKYEPYRDEPPPGPLVKLVPERALHWRASSG
ncbi:MAG TPA: pyridoxamine 5'-phosphate oxidase family protein [Thermoleophilaceae bacterium]